MSETYHVYLWNKAHTQFDNNFIVRNMAVHGESYNVESNIENVARLLVESLPGNTVDGIFNAMSNKIVELLNNPYIGSSNLNNPNYVATHLRYALYELYTGDDES